MGVRQSQRKGMIEEQRLQIACSKVVRKLVVALVEATVVHRQSSVGLRIC